MEKFLALTKQFFKALQRLAIGLTCIASIALALYLAYLEKVSAASACFTAGIILFLLSNIELFESIKAPGIQATMREIDSKVQEVEELAEKVAKTSTVTAEFSMEIMSRIGRFSGPIPREQALSLVENMSNQLLVLGVKQTKLDELLRPWQSMVVFDLLRPAYDNLDIRIQKLQKEAEDARFALSARAMDSDSSEMQNLRKLQSEVSKWKRRLQSFGDERDPIRRVHTLDAVFKDLVKNKGTSDFADYEAVVESIRQAEYFAKNGKFLDAKYWFSFDPTVKKSS